MPLLVSADTPSLHATENDVYDKLHAKQLFMMNIFVCVLSNTRRVIEWVRPTTIATKMTATNTNSDGSGNGGRRISSYNIIATIP